MPISAKWKHKSSIHIGFIVFNGGVTTFFAKSVALLLRSYEDQLQPGEMKADPLPQIFHTLVLHHKVGFD